MFNFVPSLRFKNKNRSAARTDVEVGDIEVVEDQISRGIGYEAILGPCKPYFDVDLKYTTQGEQEEKMQEDFDHAMGLVKDLYPEGKLLAFESCGMSVDKKKKTTTWKNSFHFQMNGAGRWPCGEMLPKIREFDQTVYKAAGKRQLFRLPYCSKRGEKRFKRLIKDSDPRDVYLDIDDCPVQLQDMLVQHVVDEEMVGICIPECENKAEDSDESEYSLSNSIDSLEEKNRVYAPQYSKNDIEKLVECLGADVAGEYGSWAKVVVMLKNIY